MVAKGTSSSAACRVLNRNSCGSGSKLAEHNGGCVIMTNAHVAGDRINRIVKVEFNIENERVTRDARVIEALFSDRQTADWALLFCDDPLTAVPSVPMTKKMVQRGQDLYTRGCPRCVWPPTDSDVDITNVRTDGGVAWWEPNSIGGQSGSAVWDDRTHHMICLLTWSWQNQGRMRGAGQPTGFIYQQQRTFHTTGQLVAHSRPDGLRLPPLPDDFVPDWDDTGLTDPNVPGQFGFTETSLHDYPIWAEDLPATPDPEPPAPGTDPTKFADVLIEWHRTQAEAHTAQVNRLQGIPETIRDQPNSSDGKTYGL